MTRRVKQLHQAVPRAYVELNRSDAADLDPLVLYSRATGTSVEELLAPN